MITPKDVELMNSDVSDVISDWASLVEIWTPAPIERQPGWNPVMHEVVGEPAYDKQLNVPAEVRDILNVELETGVGGAKYNGDITLCIPHVYKVDGVQTDIILHDDSLIWMDSEIWRIKSIKRRLGESIIHVMRMVGDSR